MANKLTRYLSLVFDRDAAKRMQQEAEESLAKTGAAASEEFEQAMAAGGRKAGRALSISLEREYKLRMARAKEQLAEGTISEAAFRREGEDAAKAFNNGLTTGLRRLRTQGNSTDLELANIAGRFKTVTSAGGKATLGLFSGVGPLAGVLSASAALGLANEAIAASDRMDASVRKLGGAAAVTGTALSRLEAESAKMQETFRLSVPFANEMTGAMNKLTVKAGDANALGPAMAAWLDLAAANGLTAAEAMEALNTTIIGQDEGLNKLGLANPQQIYEKWAEKAEITVAKMDDAQKAQAILTAVVEAGGKVQGEYARYLESSAGAAEQQTQKIDELRAKTGEALQPMREFGGWMKEVFYANVLGVVTVLTTLIGKLSTLAGGTWRFTIEAITTPGAVWDRLWNRGGNGGPMLSESQAQLDARTSSQAAAEAGTALDALGRPYKTPAQRRIEQQQRAAKEAADRRVAEAEGKKEADRLADQAKKDFKARVDAMNKAADAWRTSAAHAHLMGGNPRPEAGPLDLTHLGRPGPEIDRGLFGEHGEELALEKIGRFEGAYLDMLDHVDEASANTAYQISSAFQDAFTQMMEDGADAGEFLEAIGRGAAGAMLAGLAEFAQGKAKENIAAAIEAGAEALGFTSHGNFPSASAAWASAAQHAAAAVAWGALAGGAGAGRGTVTGGAGAIPGSTRDVGLSRAESAELRGTEVNLFLNPWDPSNPLMQDSVYAAQQYAAERWGPNTRVTVQPLPRGGQR